MCLCSLSPMADKLVRSSSAAAARGVAEAQSGVSSSPRTHLRSTRSITPMPEVTVSVRTCVKRDLV